MNIIEAKNKPRVSKKGRIYKKYKIKGLSISIETPKGWIRKGKDKDGTEWESLMKDDYGYINRTKGADFPDAIDCFVGPDHEPEKVWVVYQTDGKGHFDEHKTMIGYKDKQDAKKSYLRNYDTSKYFGSIKEYDFDEFKEKVLKTLHQSTASKQLGTKATPIHRLIKIANQLDRKGLYQEASRMDQLIEQIAQSVIDVKGAGNLLSNFAPTPFRLNNNQYASMEGFIQSIKYPEDDERHQYTSGMYGIKAKNMGKKINRKNYPALTAGEKVYVYYNDQRILYRSQQHMDLTERALRAKFEQNENAQRELLSTGDAELTHDTGYPENPLTSLPSKVFCDMLTRIRDDLKRRD